MRRSLFQPPRTSSRLVPGSRIQNPSRPGVSDRTGSQVLDSSRSRISTSDASNGSSFYGRRSAIEDSPPPLGIPWQPQSPVVTTLSPPTTHWQPGQYIPTTIQTPGVDIHALISQMQASITAEVKKLHELITAVSNRVGVLEESVANNAERLANRAVFSTPSSSTTNNSSCESSCGSTRKRKLPTALTVRNVLSIFHFSPILFVESCPFSAP